MKQNPNEAEFYLLPHQEELNESTARYTLLSGGVGSGKSYALILKALAEMTQQPGIKLLFTDSNWPSLRDTTYRDFFNIVPEILIQDHNKTVHQVILKNGSQAIFRAFDDANKLKRYSFGGVLCEELSDLDEDIFKMARTRIRQIGYKGFFCAATNPSTLQNWVYASFIDNPIADSKVIYSKSVDNSFLPKEYLEDLESIRLIDPEYYNRMVLGKWGNLTGLIYDLPQTQRVIPEGLQFDYYIAGLDFGFKNPTAGSVIGVSSNRYAITKELYRREMTSSDIISYWLDLHKEYSFQAIYCDSARPEIIVEMVLAGLPAVPALKGQGSVFSGIMALKGVIGNGNLFISPDCRYHMKEIDAYVWDKSKSKVINESPLKINDHAMDSMRYAIYTHIMENGAYVSAEDLLEFHKKFM